MAEQTHRPHVCPICGCEITSSPNACMCLSCMEEQIHALSELRNS